MQWRGRRESGNVEDRRGVKTAGAVGGGALILAILYALMGGDPRQILDTAQVAPQAANPTSDQAAAFIKVVLADTEDVWKKAFADSGRTYRDPKLVLFTGRVQSACGLASSAVGPFYCPGDEQVYLDLDFFSDMERQLGARGDFAQAYVVAHEVGHHVQNLLGLMGPSQPSVKVELQADCLAGFWAKAMRKVLESGDMEEALNAASAVGDDALQKASQGYVVPDSFTHGSSKQRMAAFSQGFAAESWQGCTSVLAG